jgi:hypothetical protein
VKRPSATRSTTTLESVAETRMRGRSATRYGRANSPSRKGRIMSAMNPTAHTALSRPKGTLATGSSRMPQRTVRARWMARRKRKYGAR